MIQTQKQVTWTQRVETSEEFANRILDTIEARLEEIQDEKIYALLD